MNDNLSINQPISTKNRHKQSKSNYIQGNNNFKNDVQFYLPGISSIYNDKSSKKEVNICIINQYYMDKKAYEDEFYDEIYKKFENLNSRHQKRTSDYSSNTKNNNPRETLNNIVEDNQKEYSHQNKNKNKVFPNVLDSKFLSPFMKKENKPYFNFNNHHLTTNNNQPYKTNQTNKSKSSILNQTDNNKSELDIKVKQSVYDDLLNNRKGLNLSNTNLKELLTHGSKNDNQNINGNLNKNFIIPDKKVSLYLFYYYF